MLSKLNIEDAHWQEVSQMGIEAKLIISDLCSLIVVGEEKIATGETWFSLYLTDNMETMYIFINTFPSLSAAKKEGAVLVGLFAIAYHQEPFSFKESVSE